MSQTLEEQFRAKWRRSPYLRHALALKRARHEGFLRAIQRNRLWSRILETAPVQVDPVTDSTEIELHILCYWRDYLCAIWALKSFYRFSGVRYPLAIHIHGFTTGTMLRRLRKHFPGARIISQAEADEPVERWLAEQRLDRLLARRRSNPFILRMCDFAYFCRAPYLMMFDSDVLFFDRPAELLTPREDGPSFVFMTDWADGYAVSRDYAREAFGIEMARHVNAGIAVIRRTALDLARCDRLLADVTLAGGEPTLLDQTLYALLASESGRLTQLPSSYLLSLDQDRSYDGLAARHYAGDSRTLMTMEGMPHLVATGFLQGNST